MNKEAIEKTVLDSLKRIAPETEPSELSPDENIREALGIDSFDFLQFIISLNDQLKLDIPEQDYGTISTLRNLLAYLDEKLK